MRAVRLRLGLRDGGTMRLFLLALLLLPLLGLGLTVGSMIDAHVRSEQAATRSQTVVRTVAAIDSVRAGIQREIVPMVASAIIRNPSLLQETPSAADIQEAADAVVGLPGLHAATDRAIAALRADKAAGGQAASLAGSAAKIRLLLASPSDLGGSFLAALALLTSMGAVENQQIALASTTGLDPPGLQALRDVDLTARAIEAAGFETPMYVSTLYPHLIVNVAGTYVTWLQRWALYDTASAAVASETAPPVSRQWLAVNQQAQIKTFNLALAADAAGTAKLSVAEHKLVLAVDAQRNTAYLAVLNTAFQRAQAASRAQHSTAQRDLIWIIAAAAGLVAVSLLVMAVIRKAVTKPLAQLTSQAMRISLGELPQVDVSGPHEVRTVARALAGSVANLRNVEAQAAAVARGNLDNPAMLDPLPGPLGAAMQSSITQIVTAIHEREQAQHDLAHQASHDPLTGLANRSQAVLQIGQALHRAQRLSGTTALMFVDLDYFKAVNDTFGHAAGDEVLRVVSLRMRDSLREGDLVARLGGDEFVVLLEAVVDEAAVMRLAERIVAGISQPIPFDDHTVQVGASIGVAFCRDGSVDPDQLLRDADTATYRAKAAGRNRVDLFDELLREQLRERAALERDIAGALQQGEMALLYQPVVDLETGAPVGLEALIRWERPGTGLVRPEEWVPVAEASTLINDIGRWALREATMQLAAGQDGDRGTRSLTMGVPISGPYLASKVLLGDVGAALTESGVAADRLAIDVAEGSLVDNLTATANLQALRATGVQISIVGFGTGHTPIGQIPNLLVDSLRIDRSLTSSTEPGPRQLVNLIAGAARAFGLTVVAEDIETAAQAQALCDGHVQYGLGSYFGGPQPPGTLLDAALGLGGAAAPPSAR